MHEQKNIELKKITNKTEQQILHLLNEKEKCHVGEILKELSLSAIKGQQVIVSLLEKGLIKHPEQSPRLQLNVNLI
jgi:predicted DNA-binding transcriptional regulator